MSLTETRKALKRRRALRIPAVVCLLLLLGLQLFAASGILHKAIHPDAGTPGHHCLVTLLAQGQVSAVPAAPIAAVFALVLIFCLPPFATAAVSSVDYLLSPSRAPPLS